MADADVATKAPESDAQEDIPVPTESTAPKAATVEDEEPEQPKLGEHCVTDRPTREPACSSP